MNRQSHWLFEAPFPPTECVYCNSYPNQKHNVQSEQENHNPAVKNLCLQAGQMANHLRAEIQNLKNTPKIKDPRQRQIAIEGRLARGRRWINERVREVSALLDQLSPRDLDLLYGCLARVASTIGSDTQPLRRLRGDIEKRLTGKGIRPELEWETSHHKASFWVEDPEFGDVFYGCTPCVWGKKICRKKIVPDDGSCTPLKWDTWHCKC